MFNTHPSAGIMNYKMERSYKKSSTNVCTVIIKNKTNSLKYNTFKFPINILLFSLKFLLIPTAIPHGTSASSPLSYRSFRVSVFLCVWSHTCTPYNKWNLLLSGEINASINGITIKWNRRQRKCTIISTARVENESKIMPLWQWWVLTRGLLC